MREQTMKKVLNRLGFWLGLAVIGLILLIVVGVPLVVFFWSGPPV